MSTSVVWKHYFNMYKDIMVKNIFEEMDAANSNLENLVHTKRIENIRNNEDIEIAFRAGYYAGLDSEEKG